MRGTQQGLLPPPNASAQHPGHFTSQLHPGWPLLSLQLSPCGFALTLQSAAASSKACTAPCVKCSVSCRAHVWTVGLWRGDLGVPWDLAFTGDPHPWRRSSELPFQTFSFLLVVSGLWGGGGSQLRVSPRQGTAQPGAELTRASGLRNRLVQLMSLDWHPAYSHTTCALSHPCPCNLE